MVAQVLMVVRLLNWYGSIPIVNTDMNQPLGVRYSASGLVQLQ